MTAVMPSEGLRPDLDAIATRLEEYRCTHGGFHNQKDLDCNALLLYVRALERAALTASTKKCFVCGANASCHRIISTFQSGIIFYYCNQHKTKDCVLGTPEAGED